GGLLLQRLGDLAVALLKLGVALLQLLEQTTISEGDHRLIRKRLQQSNLMIAVRPGWSPNHGDPADSLPVLHQRHGDCRGWYAAKFRVWERLEDLRCKSVGEMNGASLVHRDVPGCPQVRGSDIAGSRGPRFRPVADDGNDPPSVA